VSNLYAHGKLNDINVVGVTLKLQMQSPDYNSRDGSARAMRVVRFPARRTANFPRGFLPTFGFYYFPISNPENKLSRLFKAGSDFIFNACRRNSMPSSMVRTDLGRMAPAAFTWPPP